MLEGILIFERNVFWGMDRHKEPLAAKTAFAFIYISVHF
jgi:hypothetical protein